MTSKSNINISNEVLKKLDTIHDFGHKSNRNAPEGLNIIFKDEGSMSVFLNTYNLGNVDSNSKLNKICDDPSIQKKSVSYERRANAKVDNCTLEKAWTSALAVTWEQLINKEIEATDIESNVLVIMNGDNQDYSYPIAIRPLKGIIPGTSLKKTTARNIVGGFILNYMFPDYLSNNGGNDPIGITYDAAGAKITKVFSGFGQIKASITPENIADSASTMLDPFKDFKQYGHKRTDFIFPESNVNSSTWEFTSQEFSKDVFGITVENKSFNVNNPNGFIIGIYDKKSKQKLYDIQYDTWVKNIPMGPSAPYLSGLIETIAKTSDTKKIIQTLNSDPELKPKASNIIPLIPLIQTLLKANYSNNQIIYLLFDLKRAGDYEQANAAKKVYEMDPDTRIILGTGDILCSTYARSIQQPCILGGVGGGGIEPGGHVLVLYRFPSSPVRVDPIVKQFRATLKQMKFIIDNKGLIESKDLILQKAIELANMFEIGYKQGVMISPFSFKLKTKSLKALNNEGLTKSSVFLTLLCRLKCFIMWKALSRISTIKSSDESLSNIQFAQWINTELEPLYDNFKKNSGNFKDMDPQQQQNIMNQITQQQKNNIEQIMELIQQFNLNDKRNMLTQITKYMKTLQDLRNSIFIRVDQPPATKPTVIFRNKFDKKMLTFMTKIGYNISGLKRVSGKLSNFFCRMPKTSKPIQKYINKFLTGKHPLDDIIYLFDGTISENISTYIGELKNEIENSMYNQNDQLNDNSTIRSNIIQGFNEANNNISSMEFKSEFIFEAVEISQLQTDVMNIGIYYYQGKNDINTIKGIDIKELSGGYRYNQNGGNKDIDNFKHNIFEIIEVISTKSNEMVTDRINDTVVNLSVNNPRKLQLYEIYSITFNLYKALNRFLNACRTTSDGDNKIYLTLTNTKDLNSSMTALSQQIGVYFKKFQNRTISENQLLNSNIQNILSWVVQNTAYIQNPGSRGRRRGVIESEIVNLMKNLNTLTSGSKITPFSSLLLFKKIQNILGLLLNESFDDGSKLIEIFITAHQNINNGIDSFKEDVIMEWNNSLIDELENINISWEINTSHPVYVVPQVIDPDFNFINNITDFIINSESNNRFVSTCSALNNIFQTTSIVFDPMGALSTDTFQLMGMTPQSVKIGNATNLFFNGTMELDAVQFKMLDNVLKMIQTADNNVINNMQQQLIPYVNALINGNIYLDPLIVEIPQNIFSSPNYIGLVSDVQFIYIYPPRLGQYQIPDSNNISWNLSSPLFKNKIIEGGNKKSKKNRKRKTKTKKRLRKGLIKNKKLLKTVLGKLKKIRKKQEKKTMKRRRRKSKTRTI